MEISPILGAQDRDGTPMVGGSPLGREQFLELLITQMQMQDPFEPLNNEEMISQLATFSSLEQMQNMSRSLDDNLEADLLLGQLINNTMASTLIGRQVHVSGDTFTMEKDAPSSLGYRLHGDANNVTISIHDATGNTVRTLEAEDTGRGVHSIEWDGVKQDGEPAQPGTYRFDVKATGGQEAEIAVDSLIVGLVEGVRYADGSAHLVVHGDEYLMGDVIEILGTDGPPRG